MPPASFTCVTLGDGTSFLMTQRQAGGFLMDHPDLVRTIHPASMQPFAATSGSGKPNPKEITND